MLSCAHLFMPVTVFNGDDTRHDAMQQTYLRLRLTARGGDTHDIAVC
jgi:hypothetical protein